MLIYIVMSVMHVADPVRYLFESYELLQNQFVVWYFSGCYQPAGPLIPMSPGCDPQKVGQPALQQLALASAGSVLQPATATTTSSTTSTSHLYNKLCEEGNQVPASSRPAVDSAPAKPQTMVSPGSVEVGVGTHLADKKLNRSRSFRSSIHHSDKPRNSVGNVPIGAAHLVVADQEHELDLSQKGNGYKSAGCGAAVVTTHESIIKPAIGVVHDVSHVTVSTCSSTMSQIGHLERFVRGLVTSGTGSPVLQAPQVVPCASSSSQTASSPHDSSKAAPKRKPEQLEDSIDECESISLKRTKNLVAEEECSSEVSGSLKDEIQPRFTDTEDTETVIVNLQSSSDTSISADVDVKEDSDLDKDINIASSQPDIISAPLQSSEGQQIQHVMVEEPTEIVGSSESCELIGGDAGSSSSAAATISEKIHLPFLSGETPDTERVGNPKGKDASSGNPKKGTASGAAESKQRMSPVRSKNVADLHKKRTQTSVTVLEKRLHRVGTAQVEKLGRRSAEEGSTKSMSGRRKRDTGGWEWHGDPERKPVYFKVI